MLKNVGSLFELSQIALVTGHLSHDSTVKEHALVVVVVVLVRDLLLSVCVSFP